MSFDLGNLLQQYLGGANPNVNPAQAENDFDHVAQNVPRATVAQGVTQALRSDQTPPFSQMVGQLFGNSMIVVIIVRPGREQRKIVHH